MTLGDRPALLAPDIDRTADSSVSSDLPIHPTGAGIGAEVCPAADQPQANTTIETAVSKDSFLQELQQAAGQVTLARWRHPAAFQADTAQAPRTEGRAISMEQQALLHKFWPQFDHTERRALILASCFNLPRNQISFAMELSPLKVGKALKAAQTIMGMSIEDLLKEQNPEQSKLLACTPRTEIFWRPLSLDDDPEHSQLSDLVRIRRFTFGSAAVTLRGLGEIGKPTQKYLIAGVLAAFGMGNTEIGEHLYVAEDTVKSHMKRFFRRYGVPSREHIAPYFVATRKFSVDKPGTMFEGTERQQDVNRLLAEGLSNEEISDKLGIKVNTVKTHIKDYMEDSGYSSRSQIGLAWLLSHSPVLSNSTEITPCPGSGQAA